MDYINTIISELKAHTPGNRAVVSRLLRNSILDNNLEQEAAEIILAVVSYGIHESRPVLSIASVIVTRISKLLKLDMYSYAEGEKHAAGIKMIDYLGAYVEPKVQECIKRDGSVDYQTILLSKDNDFSSHVDNLELDAFEVDPTTGPNIWKGFTLQVNDQRSLDFVKKARRYGLHHLYNYHDIPQVYDAINKLQRTTYMINKWILNVVNSNHFFIPTLIDDKKKKKALQSIAFMKQKARNKGTLALLEESDWYADQSNIVSDWSKRMAFDKTIEKATKWQDNTLNFTYTLDSRSRVYAATPYLNPQDSDIAKSILMYSEKKVLSSEVLMVVTANHAGVDKLSFEDRIKWVDDNINTIIGIGEDPFSAESIAFIKANDIHEESKSKWQFLACCREWYNIYMWTEEGNTIDSYKTNLVCALDATCSALQIATIISRDEALASYVNLIETDKPGDIYKLSGEQLQDEVRKLPIAELTPGLQQILDHPSIRKVAKRPQMVADYSGTMKGMKEMTYQERKQNKIPAASKKDANKIGELLFKVTNHESRGSTKIKNFLRSGVKFHTQGAVIKWKTIDDFTCFQVADKSSERKVTGSIGGIKVNLKYYVFNNISNAQKHQNLICPNVTHSIDASIVRYIALRMPEDAPLAMVHDSYGTSSNYAHLLLPIVKEVFAIIGDRDWYENMVADMFGHHRTLPSPGKLTLEDINKSTYAIC